jgi:hypothetical protein
MPWTAGPFRTFIKDTKQSKTIISRMHLCSKSTDRSLLGESDVEGCDADSHADEDLVLPTPKYVFSERARPAENSYGPDTEKFDENKLLARRIQITKDMVALLRLSEPPRRGNRVNCNLDDGDDELLVPPEEPASSEEDTLKCPTIFTSFAVEYLFVQHPSHPRTNFLTSE